jgi:hypothetical protein
VAGQGIVGRVLDADTGGPVEGVLVLALAGERALDRAITTSRGTFSLQLGEPGAYVLRAERLGYAVAERALVLAAGETVEVELITGMRAVDIRGVVAEVAAGCRDPESPVALARVWSDARDILAVLTRPPQAGWTGARVERVMRDRDRGGDVGLEVVDTLDAPAGVPMQAAHPDTLATRGYVHHDDSTAVYYAPDARTILSDSFLSRHCFGVDESRVAEGRLGLTFRPRPDITLPDVSGTFWIPTTPPTPGGGQGPDSPSPHGDAPPAAIDFRWTAHPWDVAPHPGLGGRVEVSRKVEGHWIVSSWSMTIPRMVHMSGLLLEERREWRFRLLPPDGR